MNYKTTELEDWYLSTQLLMDWVAGDIGDVLCVNDYFFSVSDMVDFIKYGYSKKKMFQYYEYRIQIAHTNVEKPINIKSYKHLKK